MSYQVRARQCARCGARLASDNVGHFCASCRAKARDELVKAPTVPHEFWLHEHLRSALESWHFGRLIAAYRSHPHHGRVLPQETVAGWLNMTQAQLSRIENGQPPTELTKLTHWAVTLGVPGDILWFRLPADKPGRLHAPASRAGSAPEVVDGEPERMRPRLPASLAGFADLLASTASRDSKDSVESVRMDQAAMESFRAADPQVGGGVLYASVLHYLRNGIGPRLLGTESTREGHQIVYTSAASLVEMAGWMAHDAGRDRAAKAHFTQSLALATMSGDRQLTAHVYGSLSHLASHCGQTGDAITLAQQGFAAMRGASSNPNLTARLLAMEARGYAARRDAAACARLLGQAENAMGRSPVEPSPWVATFDAASLASETARCMRLLGDWGEARRQAEQIMTLRPTSRTRSRAFGQLALVTALIACDQIEEACSVANGVLEATRSLASSLVIAEITKVRRMLAPYQATTAVSTFLPVLDGALKERAWLTLAVGHDEQATR